MSSRFRFPRLRRPHGDGAECSSNRSLRRYIGALLSVALLFAILPVQWAAAAGGDFTITFRGAHPASYNHLTGVGGVFSNVLTTLNGGDFMCGDRVVMLTRITVDDAATDPDQSVVVNYTFGTQPTGQDGAGYRSLVSAGPNTGDPAHTANGTFTSDVNVLTNNFPVNGDDAQVGIEVTGLEPGEDFILRLVLELGCDAGESPTGVIQGAVASAFNTDPDPDQAIPGAGNETLNLMNAGAIGVPTIAIAKTADAANVSAGDTIGFSIVVSNTGTLAATNVVVTDALPGAAGLDWQLDGTVPAGCSIAGPLGSELLTCTLGSLAAASSVTIHVTSPTTAATCGLVPNTAIVTTGNNGGGTDSAVVDVQCPDVAVTKTATPELVTGGSTATFTILVSNLGLGVATNVQLQDTLPAGTWTEDSAFCSIAAGELTCNFPTLAAGASAPLITLTRPTSGNTCETLPNTAVVSAGNEPQTQTALANNTSSATISVTCAALSIAKAADASPVSAGDQIGFTVTVFNGGDAPATDVAVTDDLPGNLGLDWTLSPAVTGCAITGAVGEQVLNCTLPTVPAAESVGIHVVSPTTPATCGLIENRAILATGDPVLASVTVNCPDVRVLKTADDSSISAGETAAFTIEVTNLGPGTATGVTLNDTLPAGITWSEDNADCSIGGDTLSCIFGTLDVGETHTIHVTGATDGADCGQLDNTASVLSTNEPASVLANNSSTASIVVNCPDVAVTKEAVDSTIKAGETAGFEIVVINNGPGTATDVTLTDTLPAGITWTEDSPDCTITGNVLSCSFGDLGVGETRTINLTGVTDSADCGSISNTSIIAAVNEAAGAGGNNQATAVIKIVCPVYGSDPTTLPTEKPYEPAPGDQPTVGGENETTVDPGAGTAGTTVPVTPAPESVNDVVDTVLDVVESPLTLPRTGGELIQQAVAGLGLIGLGLVLMAVRRRRSSSTSA